MPQPLPESIDPDTKVGVLSDDQCLELLQALPVGRIGFIVDGQPMVLPVNYAWIDGAVVFRTAAGEKMDSVVGRQAVCFEVDHWDAETRTGWSVLVKGRADEVTEWAEKEALEQVGLVPWNRQGWRPVWIKVVPTAITGRAVT